MIIHFYFECARMAMNSISASGGFTLVAPTGINSAMQVLSRAKL